MLPIQQGLAKQSDKGFTLIELTVALLLIAALAAWGLPNFQAFGRNTALIGDINRMQTAFSLARNTAITQRTNVTICPANPNRSACISDWSEAIMVLTNDLSRPIHHSDIVRIFPSQSITTITYSRGRQRVSYNSLGQTSGYNGSFTICAQRDGTGRKLILSQFGRLRVDDTPIRC